jgi:uncharacterized membrane protein
MFDVMTAIHVLVAVFAVGPMAVLPMIALRGIREKQAGIVDTMARSTFVFSLVSLAVVIFGFGALGTKPERADWSVGSLWIWLSIVLYVLALGLLLGLVVPGMRAAADGLRSATGAVQNGYSKVAAGSGVATLLLIAVVVLMVTKP